MLSVKRGMVSDRDSTSREINHTRNWDVASDSLYNSTSLVAGEANADTSEHQSFDTQIQARTESISKFKMEQLWTQSLVYRSIEQVTAGPAGGELNSRRTCCLFISQACLQ